MLCRRYVTEGAMYESAIADGNRDPAARQMAVQQEARLRLYSPGVLSSGSTAQGSREQEFYDKNILRVIHKLVYTRGWLIDQRDCKRLI